MLPNLHECDLHERDWHQLPDDQQLLLSREALRRAAAAIADQAEALAAEMAAERLQDRGGPDALRLLAAIIRGAGRDDWAPAGSA